jgi:hypothetical protein
MAVDARSGRTRWFVRGALLVWFLAALGASLSGVLAQTRGLQLPVLPFAVAAPIVVFLLWYASSAAFRRFVLSFDVGRMVLVQTTRVVGGVFLVQYALGALPASFALPAGLGDVLVGITAPFVARAAWSGTDLGRRLVVVWCVIGLADLVTAVTLGILNSQTSVGLLAGPISTAPLTGFPLSLIPTFLVPLAAILHLITLRRVLEPAPAEGQRVDAPRAATAS